MATELRDNLRDSMDEKSKGTILRAMAVFTVMELCGSFLTGKTGNKTTKKNFTTSCTSDYMPAAYHRLSDLLYGIFRNGIAHSYVPKGAALLTSDKNAASHHLTFFDSGICVYVPALAEDVTAGAAQVFRKIDQEKAMRTRYEGVFAELDRVGREEYLRFAQSHNIVLGKGNFLGDIHI